MADKRFTVILRWNQVYRRDTPTTMIAEWANTLRSRSCLRFPITHVAEYTVEGNQTRLAAAPPSVLAAFLPAEMALRPTDMLDRAQICADQC
jgi:hypothetical protein